MIKNKTYEVRRILASALDLDIENLVSSRPELFNFKCLHITEKIVLLNHNPTKFAALLDIDKLSLEDKTRVVLNVRSSKIKNNINFTLGELKRVGNIAYRQLVEYNFEKYIKPELWSMLDNKTQTGVFIENSDWVMTHIKEVPHFTSISLETVAYDAPSLLDKHIADFSVYTTTSRFWINMMKFNKTKYQKIFLENTKSCTTKTDVREVLRRYPDMIKLINPAIIANSKLTCKEWILLINQIREGNNKLKEWIFSDELIDAFKMDSTAEILNGTSKTSRLFKRSMNNVVNTITA